MKKPGYILTLLICTILLFPQVSNAGSKANKANAMAFQNAFSRAKESVDPTAKSALQDLCDRLKELDYDATPYYEPKLQGQAIDKIIVKSKVYDVLVYFHGKKRWNPIAVPLDIAVDPNGFKSSKKKSGSKKPKVSDKAKSPGPKGLQGDFSQAKEGIDPAAKNSLNELCDRLRQKGYEATPYGEPKLKGTPIDKVIVNGKLYDVLVFFQGEKSWNPIMVPINR